jgi:peptidoglycan/xylan/chitin deacetylase (PgdA/CDA1 family)
MSDTGKKRGQMPVSGRDVLSPPAMSAALAEAHPLERLLRPVDPPPRRQWLDGEPEPAVGGGRRRMRLVSGDWHLFISGIRDAAPAGLEIASFMLPSGESVSARFDPYSRSIFVPFSLADAFRGYVAEEWASCVGNPRLSPRQLDLFYHIRRFLPRSWQIGARRVLVRWQGLPEFPKWPWDSSVALLLRFYALCLLLRQGRTEAAFRWFWPGSHTAAMILTHDVESAEGARLAVEIADLEEELGFRSSFNLGAWYAMDPGIVRELTARGFEVGAHGLRHDRSLFASRASFDAQAPGLASFAERIGARGFRSPSTYRVFDWLGELPFSYDCSIPHSDPFEPQPGGCCSGWPFFIGDLVELPYTLPQDHTLFTLLGHRTIELWVAQAARIEQEYGLIQCVTHPDPGYLADAGRRALYVEFLQRMAERKGVWKALPAEVASWWRLRDRGEDDDRIGEGLVSVGETAEDVVFKPPAEPT